MARSNTANVVTDFFDLTIREVTASSTEVVLQAQVRLSSRAITSPSNDFHISGAWSFRGSVPLSGVYENRLVWSSEYLTVQRAPKGTREPTPVTVHLVWEASVWKSPLRASETFLVAPQKVTVPGPPGRPTVDLVTGTSARFTWARPADDGGSELHGFRVEVAEDEQFRTPHADSPLTGPREHHTIPWQNLQPGTFYFVRVQVRNSMGWGQWSSVTRFRTLDTVPSAPPRPPEVTGITNTTATVTTHPAAHPGGMEVDRYEVAVARDVAFSSGVRTFELKGTLTVTVTDLARGVLYATRSRARNAAGWGPWSEYAVFQTLPDPPVLADAPSHGTVGPFHVRVFGPPVADSGVEYPSVLQVQYNTEPSEEGAITLRPIPFNEAASLHPLEPRVAYFYRRRAQNSAGWGPWTTWQTFISSDARGAPGWLDPPEFTDVTDTSFEVYWRRPTGLRGYSWDTFLEVARSPDGGRITRAFLPGSSQSSVVVGGPAPYSVIKPGTTYYVRVFLDTEDGPTNIAIGEVTTTGTPPPELQVFTFIDGQRYSGDLFTFFGVRRYQVRNLELGGAS